MNRRYKISLIGIVGVALVMLVGVLAAGWKPSLGLDLQGGASVVLQPKEKTTADRLDQAVNIIRARVDGLGVAEPEIARQGDAIVVSLPGVKDQRQALDIVGRTAELRFRPVLQALTATDTPTSTTTVAGGSTTSVDPNASTTSGPATTTPTATTTATPTATTAAGSSTTGAAGGPGGAVPIIKRQTDTTTAPATTVAPTTTAGATTTVAGGSTTTVASGSTTTVAGGSTTTVATAPTTTIPLAPIVGGITPPESDDATKDVVLPQKDTKGNTVARYVLGPAFLTGAAVEDAQTRLNDSSNQYTVSLTLKGGADGIDAWNAAASACFNGAATCPAVTNVTGAVAITLDGVVVSAPAIQPDAKSAGTGFSPFSRDQIQISGSFTHSSADQLSLVLRYGALPVQLVPQAVQTVSATLGKDSLHAGLAAGFVGLALVILFMILYYRWLGAIVLIGLMVSGALLWSLLSWLSHSHGLALSLSGATGIIVSIGVTVDSYVVYLEKLKDEVRSGRSLRSSAERGFKGAWRTIVAADTVSLIAAGVLYWLSVGSVRGFAFTLGLSTALDLVVAYFFTRPLVILLARSSRFQQGHVLGVDLGEASVAGATR